MARLNMAALIEEVSTTRETPDTCLHYGVPWRQLKPQRDGRLHSKCPNCGSSVSRSKFPVMAKAQLKGGR